MKARVLAALGGCALAAAIVARTQAAPACPLPERLSETGLYRPGTLDVDPRNRPFAPQYPLWTDGAAKSRWIHLPTGNIQASTSAAPIVVPGGRKTQRDLRAPSVQSGYCGANGLLRGSTSSVPGR